MKRKLFVDSFFYIALLNRRDQYHQLAAEVSLTVGGSEFWTTDLILVETANGCRRPSFRLAAARLIQRLASEPDTHIVRLSQELFEKAMGRYESRRDKAWSLTDCLSFVVKAMGRYESRRDKAWSLTDCLSFVVMEKNSVQEALSGDAHYLQAGFRTLM
jgi:predicted nucleic acid-binding protein